MTNEEQIINLLKQNQEIMKKTYESAEKTRKYLKYTAIITVVLFVLPLLGLIIVIPYFLNSYLGGFNGLI